MKHDKSGQMLRGKSGDVFLSDILLMPPSSCTVLVRAKPTYLFSTHYCTRASASGSDFSWISVRFPELTRFACSRSADAQMGF